MTGTERPKARESTVAAPKNETISVFFEGREIRCKSGASLAAVLADAGELALRNAGKGGVRGVYCGMGVCQECRIIVDGRQGIRACMTAAEGSQQLSRFAERRLATEAREPIAGDGKYETLCPDVLVIGAGAAGLTAASVAAEAGAGVVLLDERGVAGGQFHKQPILNDNLPESLAADRQIADGRALIERAMNSGAEIELGAEVWGAFAPNEFAVFNGARSVIYKPKRAIVATGAYERGLPLPGWTLPGVMTTGAAQTMLRSYGILPGKRILIAGNGPFNQQVALELVRAGAGIVAVAELAAKPGIRMLPAAARMVMSAPQLTWNGLRYIAGLEKSRVPLLYRHGLVSIEQTADGLRAWVGEARRDGVEPQTSFDVDVVCMGYGFQPSNEILRSLGCRHHYDDGFGHLRTERNPLFETSVPGVYAVGDCCGLGGAPAAREEGMIAALAAVKSLGRAVPSNLDRESERKCKALQRHRTFQSALWRLYAAPRYHVELATPDTLICRCENVCLQDVEDALEDDAVSIGSVKRRTRLGMGPCQGRYCTPIVAELIASRNGDVVNEFSFFAPRSPIKPIRIADIVKSTVD